MPTANLEIGVPGFQPQVPHQLRNSGGEENPPLAMLFSRLSIGKKEQPVGGKLDLPGLWGIAESFPLPLENLGLQMMVGGRRRRTADSQIESDAEGRLGHGGKPAGKCVLASSERS